MADRTMAHVADALTALRFVLAVPIAVATAGGHWTIVGVLLASSWMTDFFDGRMARRGGGGLLGAHDLDADTLVGSGAVVGLALGGRLPVVALVVAGLCGLGYVVLRNVALAMLTQAIGYGGALWWMYHEGRSGLSVALVTITVVGVLDAERLRHHVLPSFFAGLRPRQLFGRSGR